MKLLQLFSLITLFLITTAGTCKKDDNNSVKTPTPEDLIKGRWRITADYTDQPVDPSGTGQFTTDMFAYMDSCRRDNILIFKAGGLLDIDEGATKCNSSDPQTFGSGTWQLSYPTLATLGIEYTILQLDSTHLKMTFKDTIGNIAVTETAELLRQ